MGSMFFNNYYIIMPQLLDWFICFVTALAKKSIILDSRHDTFKRTCSIYVLLLMIDLVIFISFYMIFQFPVNFQFAFYGCCFKIALMLSFKLFIRLSWLNHHGILRSVFVSEWKDNLDNWKKILICFWIYSEGKALSPYISSSGSNYWHRYWQIL